MATLTYRDHLIVAGVDFSGTTRSWLAKVSVSWNIPGSHGIHFITKLSEHYQSADHAVNSGFAVGKSWVDNRLKSVEGIGSLELPSHQNFGREQNEVPGDVTVVLNNEVK